MLISGIVYICLQVLKAFVHGDGNLFNNYPELEESLVYVFFHSNIPEFNKVECWGPLKDASAPKPNGGSHVDKEGQEGSPSNLELPRPCKEECDCCFPPWRSLIPRFREIINPLDNACGGAQHQSYDPLNSSGDVKWCLLISTLLRYFL